jgi:hypothetical protein
VNKGVTISLVGGLALVLSAVILSCGFLTAAAGGPCNGGGPCLGIESTTPFYLLFAPIARVWGWEAAPFIVGYAGSLALSLGVALLMLAVNEATNVLKTGWLTLLVALVVGVGLANVSGIAYPQAAFWSMAPFCSVAYGCSRSAPLFAPPVWQWVQTYPALSVGLVLISVLFAVVRVFLTHRVPRRLPASVVRSLQLLPVMTVTLIGMVALVRFPFPYPL